MAKECENCAYKSEFKSAECGSCVVSYYDGEQQGLPSNFKPKPMTNADRIRAMSDEELAELLSNEVPHDCAYCNLVCATFDGDKFAGSCQNAFYRWLQQPAEG